MKENIKTIKVYESDRNWLEKLKRRYSLSSLTETFKLIRKLVQHHKLEGEVKK